ncbi:meiosis protein mei2 [Vairimorpha ceranae]|uniref:Meiosis protein mei2 n=1 Tax=Vairimorpha ceranae TaxID=40302 RepID=A0A0F9WV71_9MICR|nr:meiosis protein mei2 [Vairimorpha ceranae]KAF5141648.1 hypothetical protein G9O61_00g001900 [Vairimorpha ceranae]KKO76638.1 meiosis protein mei2 [Vairimorpha ceranae]
MNKSFIEFSDKTLNYSSDDSLTIDSSFLKYDLLLNSVPYSGIISKEPKSYAFPKFIPRLLLGKNPIICDEEVYFRLYGHKTTFNQKIKKKEYFTNEKENSSNTTNNNPSDSLFLRTVPVLINPATELKYKINIHDMDSRTTCMIKNIPNKYTQKMLINLLNEHHFGCYDFVYLRMDFKNKCNVGYAFVNFTCTEHIKTFYKKINNKGWKLFSSNKIAELTYASIQGFDSLVNKFKNSNVMKEQESYRPKIFHKEGNLKGYEKSMF